MNERIEEFQQWLRMIQDNTGLTKEGLGLRTAHFVEQGGKLVCKHHCRNSVGNWFAGRSMPRGAETIVSLALLQYGDKPLTTYEERRQRCAEVQDFMTRFWGRELYCRTLSEAFLIAAIVGIYRLEEIPHAMEEMTAVVEQVELTDAEVQYYANVNRTQEISTCIFMANTKADFYRIVNDWREYFQVGARTIGTFFENVYNENREKMYNLTLRQAIDVYVPRVADSYARIFRSEFGASRSWIIDLCIHLHFSRDQINRVLRRARMIELSVDETDEEYYIRCLPNSRAGIAIGSTEWYHEREKIYMADIEDALDLPDELKIRYNELEMMSLRDKMTILTLLATYIDSQNTTTYVPPIDYFLEFFIQNETGVKVLRGLKNYLMRAKRKSTEAEEFLNQLKVDSKKERIGLGRARVSLDDVIIPVIDRIVKDADSENEIYPYEIFRNSFSVYYSIPESKYENIENLSLEQRRALDKLRLLAAMSYSVILGRLYHGILYGDALDDLENTFLKDEIVYREDNKEDVKDCWAFLNLFWKIFLSVDTQIHIQGEQIYYVDEKGESDRLTYNEIMQNILEMWYIVARA